MFTIFPPPQPHPPTGEALYQGPTIRQAEHLPWFSWLGSTDFLSLICFLSQMNLLLSQMGSYVNPGQETSTNQDPNGPWNQVLSQPRRQGMSLKD